MGIAQIANSQWSISSPIKNSPLNCDKILFSLNFDRYHAGLFLKSQGEQTSMLQLLILEHDTSGYYKQIFNLQKFVCRYITNSETVRYYLRQFSRGERQVDSNVYIILPSSNVYVYMCMCPDQICMKFVYCSSAVTPPRPNKSRACPVFCQSSGGD